MPAFVTCPRRGSISGRRIAFPIAHAAEDGHPHDGLSFSSPSHRLHMDADLGRGGENTGDRRADVLAVDFHDAHQTAGCPVLSLTVCHSPPRESMAWPQAGPHPTRASTKRCLRKVERTNQSKAHRARTASYVNFAPLRIPG